MEFIGADSKRAWLSGFDSFNIYYPFMDNCIQLRQAEPFASVYSIFYTAERRFK